jgi:hypothetical protein
MMVMDRFDGLFEVYWDEQSEDNGGNVNREVLARVGSVMLRMNVEHRSLVLINDVMDFRPSIRCWPRRPC